MLVYNHRNKVSNSERRGTIVVDAPSKKDLESMFYGHAEGILLNIGAVILHPNENYCKNAGRQLSTQKLAPSKCYFSNVEFRKNTKATPEEDVYKHVYHFTTTIPCSIPGRTTITIEFGLGTIKESDESHLIYANFV